MAGLKREELAGKNAYLASQGGAPEIEWKDLNPEQRALWISQAEGGVSAELDPAGKTDIPGMDADRQPEEWLKDQTPPPIHKFDVGGIEIEQIAPGRYVIKGFSAGSIYIPDVGNLAPPAQIDLPMTANLAAALRSVIADFEKGGNE